METLLPERVNAFIGSTLDLETLARGERSDMLCDNAFEAGRA